MFENLTSMLEWMGLAVFAASGALVASRKNMDIVGFALLATVTGIGGGTVRDLVLGLTPVRWVREPNELLVCVGVGVATFFIAHLLQSRLRLLLWLDAVGLAVFSVTGAQTALLAGASASIAVALGVASATLGGVVRDILGGESPVVLRREVYVTAALVGASVFVACRYLGISPNISLVAGFAGAFAVRAAALIWNLSLPRYENPRGS
jgi:uncharacterized membrane protein YeiH